jgi:hypothetical protein
MPPKETGHKVHRVKARILDSRTGLARLVSMGDGSRLPAEMATSAEFANPRFQNWKNGAIVIATFRISPTGRRYLLSVRAADGEEKVGDAIGGVPVEDSLTIDGYYYSPDIRRTFSIADRVAKAEGMFVGLMIGPSGYGKTTIPMKFAEKTGRKFVRVNCSAVRDPEEWLGFREARSGDTIFEPTEFAQALMGGNSVIVLDEVNRIEPWLHNTLFPLLDFSHKTVVHNKEFVVGPNTIVMMTMNRGLEYVGTFELDQAFINRSDVVMMVGAPPATEEVQILVQRTSIEKSIASRIVNLLASLRSTVKEREIIVDCSTRAALKIANLVKAGASLREAFHDTIEIASINSEDMKKIADIMNSAIGTFESIRPPANQDAFLG